MFFICIELLQSFRRRDARAPYEKDPPVTNSTPLPPYSSATGKAGELAHRGARPFQFECAESGGKKAKRRGLSVVWTKLNEQF